MSYYVASCSFGKDSLAMILKILENTEKYPLDEVVFFNIGMEFPVIYEIKEKVEAMLKERHVVFTELFIEGGFEYMMFDKIVKKRDGTIQKGLSWCGYGGCRWGTAEKITSINRYLKSLPYDRVVQYVGVAADEEERLSRKICAKGHKVYPLSEMGMTETDCLKYCYERGFDYCQNGVPLYSILSHVSCWCCGYKSRRELLNYYQYMPEIFEKLKDFQRRTFYPFKGEGGSVFDLEEKFASEGACLVNMDKDALCGSCSEHGLDEFDFENLGFEIEED